MTLNPLPFAMTLGGITFIMTVIWGGPLIEVLRRLKIGHSIRVDGPEWQKTKEGTPTMGGLLILVPVVLITLGLNLVNLIRPNSAARVTGVSILLPLAVLVGFGVLGGIDDWIKLRSKGEGISVRAKFIGQIAMAAICAFSMSLFNGGVSFANEIYIPVMGVTIPISPILYIPLVIVVIVGFSNAVNFTDGLDGLAGAITSRGFPAPGFGGVLEGENFFGVVFFFF